jgi:tRNA A37 threonylcarbamoyladenosine biosynthesis protein TsaE
VKLIVPKLEIRNDEGFSQEADIFSRKDFGERLANLVEQSSGNIVLALDAQWGEGKSTFIKMWRGYIEHKRENKIKSIYFDAFANDYQRDPFLALAAEMYELRESEV